MRLKRIKLAGFKSFVDATSIPFPGEMTAIVGPNGCGKSNVIDAVRWVLGESSAKNLRGDAMTDVIFNGSSARKPVSQCSVELVFDNTSNRLQGEFAKYNELAVKRIVTRDAQSTYLLNGTKCRRRDVTDIFLGTGLGPRSYAIIEQGMISRLIESKPQELRVFIEEAAGISKYKERRRETENRIRHTRENLERLADVRSELGTQLDKLQRQAAAARRYKELKAKERRLKAELAAIRWLAHSEKVTALQHQIDEGEVQVEALVSQQRGDERKLIEQRQQQFESKQRLDELQQQLFDVSTEIARLEQNQKYVTERTAQVEQESKALATQREHVEQQVQDASAALEEALAAREALAPELAICQEQLLEASQQREDAELALTDFARQFRQQEQDYMQLKSQSQSCHSQIQSTMSMQLRTQQRLSEIEMELTQEGSDQLHEQLATLQEQLLIAEQQLDEAKDSYQQRQDELVQQNAIRQQYQQAVNEALQNVQRLSAEHAALEALQHSETATEDESLLKLSQLWQVLDIEQGYEGLFDLAIAQLQNAYVVSNEESIQPQWSEQQGLQLLLRDQWSTNKVPGTLASLCVNASVPNILNTIYFAENEAQLKKLRSELQPGASLVTFNGVEYMLDSMKFGVAKQQGKAVRAARAVELTEQIALGEEGFEQAQQALAEVDETIARLQQQLNDADQQKQHTQQAHYQLQNKVGMLELQMEQSEARRHKLLNDQQEQQTLLSKEQTQLEELSARVEAIEEQLLEFESQQLHYEERREAFERTLATSRASVEALTQQKHQHDLNMQQLQGQVGTLQQRRESHKSLFTDLNQRLAKLHNELNELRSPQSDSAERVAELLAKREEISLLRDQQADQLADVERVINDAQKDSQGLTERLQQRRSQLESLKLEAQGYQVRATAVLEQLEEADQNLKTTLEGLPDDTEDQAWQQELEKTTNSISRLGAVNLAAVDEFEVQSERKQHLDAQYDDLNAALETLEEAIRKIDKETKTRFRHTFDQVNGDLKQLFPKVFGGGSAYLDLTDDDLLETGVTIMARPPGKKNSTIHLLSGGEKALTALSLVFAIFRLNPAPFCLLDEVDAPLDDANVERFCRLVSEMSQTVQFIYITHNKIAMEMAEHLTGVTMAEPGVSRMVAVDVEEAVAIANS
ncbi:chromosome segregation protein SMC [Alteromonas sp. ASW11-36]|uniref:Chromosome partition protein Smc n=1 Tax=Alteromonas arenosi TaxID=3055817 RepID=A0ABT7SYN8_9ALTE|nr:chromosome segregation protein SMC [Alteromonas sp. ASW11-36]MDM7860657.1 chromosome segregation protein SMC [Alteromonas sp. ASW11-36]